MNVRDDSREKLKRLLREAYFEKEKRKVGDQWQLNVMRRIRQWGSLNPQMTFSWMVEQLIWRLSPVLVTLIVVCAIVLMNIDFISDPDVIHLLAYESDSFNFMEFLLL